MKIILKLLHMSKTILSMFVYHLIKYSHEVSSIIIPILYKMKTEVKSSLKLNFPNSPITTTLNYSLSVLYSVLKLSLTKMGVTWVLFFLISFMLITDSSLRKASNSGDVYS